VGLIDKFCPCLIQAAGRSIVAAFVGDCIHLFKANAGLEIAMGRVDMRLAF
jgi:hypothetical protein